MTSIGNVMAFLSSELRLPGLTEGNFQSRVSSWLTSMREQTARMGSRREIVGTIAPPALALSDAEVTRGMLRMLGAEPHAESTDLSEPAAPDERTKVARAHTFIAKLLDLDEAAVVEDMEKTVKAWMDDARHRLAHRVLQATGDACCDADVANLAETQSATTARMIRMAAR